LQCIDNFAAMRYSNFDPQGGMMTVTNWSGLATIRNASIFCI